MLPARLSYNGVRVESLWTGAGYHPVKMEDKSILESDDFSHSKLLDALSDPDEDFSYQVDTSADLRSKNVPPGEFRKYDVLFYYDDEDETLTDDARIPGADSYEAHEFESQSTQSATQSQSRSECSPSEERSGASLVEAAPRRSGYSDFNSMPGWSGIGKGLPGGVGRGVSAGLAMARLQPASSNGSLLGRDSSSERGGIGRNGSGRTASGAAAAVTASSTCGLGKLSQDGSAYADMAIGAAGLAELDLTVDIPDVRKTGMSFIVRPPTASPALHNCSWHLTPRQAPPICADFPLSCTNGPHNSGRCVWLQAPTGLTLEGLCERVNAGWAGSTVSLGDATVSAPGSSRVRSITRRGSGALNAPGHPIRLCKRKRTFDNRLRMWSLADPPVHASVHAVTAAGITLCNGCVSLPSEGYWVFTSPGAMLQDMRVCGALSPVHTNQSACNT